MRLTTELINKSLSYINPIAERELDLRGHKIPAIENLGAAKDNDCIDFTDNDIAVVGNFPLTPRLQTLLLAHNRVTRIDTRIAEAIPNVTTIILTKNRIEELGDLDPLSGLRSLEYLSLLENPVTQKEHYRSWVIFRCPTVRFLDFKRVTLADRNLSKSLFGTIDKPKDLVAEIASRKTKTFDLPISARNEPITPKEREMNLTAEENARLKEFINRTTSLAEMTKIENAMAAGRLPPGFILDAAESAHQT